jgi:hypothetical protein
MIRRVDNRRVIVRSAILLILMFLVHNERTKLTASWLNTLATALIAAGAFAPAAARLYGLAALPIETLYLSAPALACAAGGFGLHIFALAVLGRLHE